MKQIELTQGKYALVDPEDCEHLIKFKWKFDNTVGYACRTLYPKGKEYMHKVILPTTTKGLEVDHINRNKLDNRRENLRLVNRIENMRNTGLKINNKSGCKGVWFWEKRNKWTAFIFVNYKKIHLGIFDKIEQAIEARKKGEEFYWI